MDEEKSGKAEEQVKDEKTENTAPGKNAGERWAGALKHVFSLIFFGSFLDQAKKERSVRCSIDLHEW